MIETQARMIRRVQALAQEHEGETVGIVSHGDPLRATVAFYMGIPMDMLLRFEISPCVGERRGAIRVGRAGDVCECD